MIEGARKRGLDITTEAYPYTAGMTDISVRHLRRRLAGAQRRHHFRRPAMGATGERLTAESFARYRKQGGMVAIHAIPEDIATTGDAPDLNVIVASDGIMENGKGHPRAAGTYARVLGRYVREQHVLSLMDALRKMTAMPADSPGREVQRPDRGGRRRRYRRLRPGARDRPGHLREARAVFRRHPLCTGERYAGRQKGQLLDGVLPAAASSAHFRTLAASSTPRSSDRLRSLIHGNQEAAVFGDVGPGTGRGARAEQQFGHAEFKFSAIHS